MIDTWLIFTLVIPFIEVILHTKMVMTRQRLSEMEDQTGTAWEGNKKKMNRSIKKHNETLRFVMQSNIQNFKIDLKYSLHFFRILQKIATYGLPFLTFLFLCIFFTVGAFFMYF